MAVTKAKKKDIKIVSGILHVHTTSNNTLITLIDQQGNKILGGGTGKVAEEVGFLYYGKLQSPLDLTLGNYIVL